MSMDASSESNNGGTTGETAHKGDASDFIDTADLGDYVDAIIGPVRSNSLHPTPLPMPSDARYPSLHPNRFDFSPRFAPWHDTMP